MWAYVIEHVSGCLYVYKDIRMFRCARGCARASVWTAEHMLTDVQGFITVMSSASLRAYD